ncbi:protein piccolo-like isoform X1 [Portunus trituberculatus]|uniref:protein piccolo-like isoform X1 n=1 Tax=Portunus trituberculatus TaxID=210409 RepID=UPI001E1CDE1C|nr:protein piccolo-like isoform X1 [Portunus trituberculatus]
MDPYRSPYMNDYHSHPSLGRSPGGSMSPPRHSQGRPSRSSSPVSRQHYNTPGRGSPMGRSPREDRGSPPHHDYNSRSAPHTSESHSYRRGDASPPYYRRNLPVQHEENGSAPRRSKAGVPRPTKVKRFLLTRDPKDRRISGNGLGMKVVGGKEIPGTRGRLGAYIARLHPGGVAESLGQLKEGDLLLEWNGVSLVDRTYEEVQSIVTHSVDDLEVEIVVRSDINMITGERLTGDKWQGRERERGVSASTNNSSHHASPQRRSDPPIDDPLDINGNRSSSEGPLNDTTGSNSQETVFGNDSHGYEREREGTRLEALGDSSHPASPRARSSSRPRYASNSPDARSRRPSSPGAERPTNRDLRRVNDVGTSGENAHLSDRGSPVPHTPRERRPHNSRNRAPPEASSREITAEGGRVTSERPARHRSSSAGGSRRLPDPRQTKGAGATTGTMTAVAAATTPTARNQEQAMGEVQLQVCYDSQAGILYVTVLRARGLHTVREDGDTRPDPFIKVYLLPGRSVENQRRTRYFSLTSNPEWNQTMVYPNLQPADLAKRHLEVTAWNYQPDRPNEYLGEVVLDLSELSLMDEELRWYQLQELDREELPEHLPGAD